MRPYALVRYQDPSPIEFVLLESFRLELCNPRGLSSCLPSRTLIDPFEIQTHKFCRLRRLHLRSFSNRTTRRACCSSGREDVHLAGMLWSESGRGQIFKVCCRVIQPTSCSCASIDYKLFALLLVKARHESIFVTFLLIFESF